MTKPSDSAALLQHAIGTAVEAHRGQTRAKSPDQAGVPYVVHPIEVMKTLWDWGVRDANVLVAAVLHDCLEDTPLDPWQIEDEFGPSVRTMVEELTFRTALDSDAVTRSQQKADYLAAFDSRSIGAVLIKVADRLCNTWDFLQDRPDYAAAYLGKANRLFEALAARSDEVIQHYGNGVRVRMLEAKKYIDLAIQRSGTFHGRAGE